LDEAKIKKLAAILFDTAAKEGERTNALAMIKRLAGGDREQLVEALLSGLKGDAGKNRSTTDELFSLKMQVSTLKFELSSLKMQVSTLNLQVSTLRADLERARAARDYVMDVRDRVVAELGQVKTERDQVKAELDYARAERWREQQRSASLPQIKCAAPGCTNLFVPNRRGHRTCSDSCRKALSRTQVAIQ
jgi:chromosome segregation ATPase